MREAFANYSRMDVAAMWDLCDRMAETDKSEVEALYEINSRFHMKLAEPGVNQVLVRILRQLWQLPSSLRLFHAQAHLSSAMKATEDEHRRVVEAIEAADRELAVARLDEHIRAAEVTTLKEFGDGALDLVR